MAGRAAVLDGPAGSLLEAVDEPAHDERAARAEHQVAQGVEAARLVGRADLEQQVAVGELGLDPVVAEVGHPDQLARDAVGEPEPVVEQRRPEPDRDRQVGRSDRRPEDPALGRREERIARRRAPSPAVSWRLRAVSSARAVASSGLLPTTASSVTKIAAVCGRVGRTMPAWCGPSNGM